MMSASIPPNTSRTKRVMYNFLKVSPKLDLDIPFGLTSILFFPRSRDVGRNAVNFHDPDLSFLENTSTPDGFRPDRNGP
jgi:hypothetical protein